MHLTIAPDGDVLGSVSHYPVTGRWFQPDIEITARTRNYLETSFTVYLAGPAAERKARGRWNLVGAESDRSRAVDFALRLVGTDRQLQLYFSWREQIAWDLWGEPPRLAPGATCCR